MNKIKKYTLKIIIIGELAVGKTSLVKKFITGKFSKDYRSSIGTNIFIKKINLKNNGETTLQLWDIAGQERWINLRHSYYTGTKGAIIVADLSRKNTFEQIEKFWVPDFRLYCDIAPIILIANKSDLKKDVDEHEINTLGKNINAKSVFITSAKTGENIELAFQVISELAKKNLELT